MAFHRIHFLANETPSSKSLNHFAANNGKIAYCFQHDITIDGSTLDWNPIDSIAISDSEKSLRSYFKTAYNDSKQLLYFLVVVEDDHHEFDSARAWYQNDNVILYLNPGHEPVAPSCEMLIVNEEGLNLYQNDKAHQFFNKKAIDIRIEHNGNRWIYEGSIALGRHIRSNRSLGFDVMVVDADPEKPTTYNSWGPGGFKEYQSGKLGDLVLLAQTASAFGFCKGSIAWEDNDEDDLPEVIKIQSQQLPDIWLHTEVDSMGRFYAKLPAGKYSLSSAYKIGSARQDHGYGNQLRIDERTKLTFDVEAGATTALPQFSIPTFEFPEYLFLQEGLLHHYDESQKAVLETFIQATCSYYNIPGASVALVKDGKVVYHNIFGVENLLTQEPLTDTTVFQAASVTKAVFSFIVLRLVERGLLDLDKPLYAYLPFDNIAHDPHYKKLTATHILSHQSGLSNWAFGGPGGYISGQKTDLQFEPGTKFQYSGEGFEYLGRVIEHITQKNLKQLLKEEVVEALGIPPLYFCDEGNLRQARGHYADSRPTYYGSPTSPGVAHSILTEAHAFAHWMAALANRKGLSEETYSRLLERLSTTNDFDSPENLYWNLGVSLGFFVQDTPYGSAILHGGNNGDFQGEFVLFPEKKMGFVVFTNSNAGHKLGQQLGKFLIHGKK
jgi:CubicO group peptidase (beta-lactamase class C family)